MIEPVPKSEHAKPMSDREYRSAENGKSWKIRLEASISNVMQTASSKEHFIMLMETEGYCVKWTDTWKNITYKGYRETGWENERELFERALFGEGDYRASYEEDVSDLYDPVRSSDSIGTDTLYLIGGIGNLIDEDAPVEDSTTMYPRKERKKYNGPVMGGM